MTGRRLLLIAAATLLAAATAVLAGILIATWTGLDVRDAAAAERDNGRREERREDFSWSGTVAAGRTVSIHGINGEVRARAGSGRTLEVRARKIAKRGDPDDVRIDVVPHEGGVTVCVVYVDAQGRPVQSCDADGIQGDFDSDDFDHDSDVRVEFDVEVPEGADFDVHWVNGSVSARDLDGDVAIETVNGDVDFSTTGTARAETVNGSIEGSLGAPSWSGTLAFETVNGNVHLSLPRSLRASITADTVHGNIKSDVPGRHDEGEWGPHSFRSDATGRSLLKIETVNGSVRLAHAR